MINSKSILEAYLFLRRENQKIPSEVIEFMKEASLDKLSQIEISQRKREAELNRCL